MWPKRGLHAQGGRTDIETAQGCESYQHKYIKEEEKTFMKRKSYQHKYILETKIFHENKIISTEIHLKNL